jgi:hypothetical protein
MALMTIGLSYVGSLFLKSETTTKVMPEILSTVSDGTGLVGMIFITLFCTFDFSEGTTKNIVARGYSKVKLLLSKYIGSLIGILSMDAVISVIIFILYFRNGMGIESSTWITLVVYLVKTIADTVLFGTLAFILEKTSSAIIANLFIPNVVSVVLGLANSKLKVDVSKYWIDNLLTAFSKNPVIGNAVFPIIMYVIYIAVLTLIGIWVAKNKEIK